MGTPSTGTRARTPVHEGDHAPGVACREVQTPGRPPEPRGSRRIQQGGRTCPGHRATTVRGWLTAGLRAVGLRSTCRPAGSAGCGGRCGRAPPPAVTMPRPGRARLAAPRGVTARLTAAGPGTPTPRGPVHPRSCPQPTHRARARPGERRPPSGPRPGPAHPRPGHRTLRRVRANLPLPLREPGRRDPRRSRCLGSAQWSTRTQRGERAAPGAGPESASASGGAAVEKDEPVTEPITTPQRLVTVMVIPADAQEPITLVTLEDSTPAIAAAVQAARVDDDQVTTCTGTRLGIHVDAEQPTPSNRRQGNTRAAMVLARLGVEHREVLARLHGGVAITGRDPAGADTPVPQEVLTAVTRCGIKPPSPPGDRRVRPHPPPDRPEHDGLARADPRTAQRVPAVGRPDRGADRGRGPLTGVINPGVGRG
jgi:hypothetical protein